MDFQRILCRGNRGHAIIHLEKVNGFHGNSVGQSKSNHLPTLDPLTMPISIENGRKVAMRVLGVAGGSFYQLVHFAGESGNSKDCF